MIIHKPVLLKESIEGLNLKKDSVIVDATLGGGGHAREILKKIGSKGIFIGIDADINSIKNFAEFPISNFQFPNKSEISNFKTFWKSEADNLFLVKDNFANLKNILGGMDILAVDGILADLGYSSLQLEDEKYGMSFLKDAPLDMRLDKEGKLTARKIVNEYGQQDLARIIKNYGEERFANSIAKKIIEQRKLKPIERTLELVKIIGSAVPEKYKHAKTNFATRTFQALRIEVNQELVNLEEFIPVAIEKLSEGGRLAIISFHSLEDRIVKNIFRENARGCICPENFPECRCEHKAKVRIITKKPMVPSFTEISENPRARSAKLRIAEKI